MNPAIPAHYAFWRKDSVSMIDKGLTLSFFEVGLVDPFRKSLIDTHPCGGVEDLPCKCGVKPASQQELPSIETLHSIFLGDISGSSEKIGLLFGIMNTADFFRLELDDCLDHVDRLDEASCQHARNSSNPERLNKIQDSVESRTLRLV